MLFNSFEFFILLGLTLIPYWLFTKSLLLRQGILLISSLVFYTYWYPPYLLLLISIALITYIFSQRIIKKRNAVLAFSILLGNLFFFKYLNFSINQLNLLLGLSLPNYDIKLPLGISFITFQAIGYLVDLKKKEVPQEKNFLYLLLFLNYFPQLIAGPICRAKELIPQLHKNHRFKLVNLSNGMLIFAMGLVLKVLIADTIAPFVDSVFVDPAKQSGSKSFIGILTYGVQIFSDFWGYSTMAIGISKMFGIQIPINFNLPYFSLSLQEFWRKWHITLSFWLRDYLYIPLGGSKATTFATYKNLMITMVLGGIWHGANWTFVVWGIIHGGFLAIERLLNINYYVKKHKLLKPFQWLLTMFIVFTAWTFFRAQSVTDAGTLLVQSLDIFNHLSTSGVPKSVQIILFIFMPLSYFSNKLIFASIKNKVRSHYCFILSFWILFLTIVFSSENTPKFIYFDF